MDNKYEWDIQRNLRRMQEVVDDMNDSRCLISTKRLVEIYIEEKDELEENIKKFKQENKNED